MSEFRADLLEWFGRHQRDLPWRRTRDPYAIWISEIMLQQTRVAAVIPYYERFLSRFPTFQALAEAPEAELLAHWAGLGYYYRARNLQKAARVMRESGAFPTSYEEIRSLPGIGDYTAAAIASIAFGLPHAVLDGNVFRVLSRVRDDAANIASNAGRKHFAKVADEVLDPTKPGMFNQAMMELGATICLPANPQCLLCPAARFCGARGSGRQNELPVKIVLRRSVEEHRTVFWIERRGDLLLWQRAASVRLMPGFWELPERAQLPEMGAGRKLGSFRHGITFHKYRFDVVEASAPTMVGPCKWIRLAELADLPVSTVLKKAKRVVDERRGKGERASEASGGG
ncbi:MAG TPA: A/G-specific adenine glycosylase [Bryobacteraceae bacterium]|nr:A/G-specific adenine glycosylase [Bryobacteraceae bacterium]